MKNKVLLMYYDKADKQLFLCVEGSMLPKKIKHMFNKTCNRPKGMSMEEVMDVSGADYIYVEVPSAYANKQNIIYHKQLIEERKNDVHDLELFVEKIKKENE